MEPGIESYLSTLTQTVDLAVIKNIHKILQNQAICLE